MPVPNTHPAVDYAAGRDETATTTDLATKLGRAIEVTRVGLTCYDDPAILWTGGKDSTLVLYVAMQVAQRDGLDVPPVVFIDHLQHFREVTDFVHHWADRWGLDLLVARNEDVATYVELHEAWPGEPIPVDVLDDRTRRQLREDLEFEGESFPFHLDTLVGNHLLKTVALNDAIEANGFDAVFSGVRWDEQAARADETFFSPRHDPTVTPPHDRVQPILHFSERDVWAATWHHLVPDTVGDFPDAGYEPRDGSDLPDGVTVADLPVSPKYFEGFRSLGSEHGTSKADDRPAWRQDLDRTAERAGREQDKEHLMERLRELGYM